MRKAFLRAALLFAAGGWFWVAHTHRARAMGVVDTYSSGTWDAFEGTAVDGGYLCGTGTSWLDGRRFWIKYFVKNDSVRVQIFKMTWNIPVGTAATVAIKLDQAVPFSAKAYGSGNMLELSIQPEQMTNFFNLMRYSVQMTILFPDGTEPPWRADMSGSNGAIVTFMSCVLKHPGASATEPFGGRPAPSPTQPFMSQPRPSPSQPYTPS